MCGLMRGARHRRGTGWFVRARVERFSEPALLLLLRERPAHGYELVEGLEAILPGERVDMGNVYRALRALEREGLVESRWDAEAPGAAKRVYQLTEAGSAVLEQWAGALGRARDRIDGFLERYEQGGGEHVSQQ
jgi:PadR family transcriptional regulator, regulatory protein PadR